MIQCFCRPIVSLEIFSIETKVKFERFEKQNVSKFKHQKHGVVFKWDLKIKKYEKLEQLLISQKKPFQIVPSFSNSSQAQVYFPTTSKRVARVKKELVVWKWFTY